MRPSGRDSGTEMLFTTLLKDMEKTKRNAFILFAVAAITLAIGVSFYLIKSKDKNKEAPVQNVYADLPEAEDMEIPESKSEAYMRGEGKKAKIEDYWDDCLPDKETLGPQENGASRGVSAAGAASTEDLLGLKDEPVRSAAPSRPSGNPYRETPQEREARHQRRHEEALELAERIQEGQGGRTDEEIMSEIPVESIPLPEAEVRRSSNISSVDGWGEGLSSLDADTSPVETDSSTPFRCMFARDSKITDGQRVTVILLEDLTVSGISVPRNTHLMATCHISNRLELEFANIEIGGRILPLGYEAYDIDGSKGIYCPDAGSAGRTVKGRGADIIGGTLSGRLGRVAREVTSTGIALIQSADGQRTVSVPAGYTFFIVKKNLN